jgi:hypothetical protein
MRSATTTTAVRRSSTLTVDWEACWNGQEKKGQWSPTAHQHKRVLYGAK